MNLRLFCFQESSGTLSHTRWRIGGMTTITTFTRLSDFAFQNIMTEHELLYVFLKEIEASLPGEFRRLGVVAFTHLVAEPMLGLVAIKRVVHLPFL